MNTETGILVEDLRTRHSRLEPVNEYERLKRFIKFTCGAGPANTGHSRHFIGAYAERYHHDRILCKRKRPRAKMSSESVALRLVISHALAQARSQQKSDFSDNVLVTILH
jgi:hypothetical protein